MLHSFGDGARCAMSQKRTRIIYYGDNLEILRDNIAAESVDLVYLDPPFKSQQQYNVLYRNVRGEPAEAQVRAFTDTWKWDRNARATYDWLMQDPGVPGNVSKMIESFHQFLGASEMLAYLVMMTPRLLELHRVLKTTGSLFLHCDPAASHYLKVVLDSIFGPTHFRNEIVWQRFSGHGNVYRSFGRIHDILLFYTKGEKWMWNQAYRPLSEKYVDTFFRYLEPGTGRRYRLQNVLNPNKNRPNLTYEWNGHVRVWKWTRERMKQVHDAGLLVYSKTGLVKGVKQYLDESRGEKLHDIWDEIKPIGQSDDKKLGYETQKPLELLRRIIQVCTNPGDLVLDPFCGCGTALVAAEELGRSWIGIDITYLAVDVMARRLHDHFPGISFEIRGQPQDEEGARALAERDRFQFQVWALSLVGAQTLDPDSKVADRGIDGYLNFLASRDKYEQAIVQVKSGHVGPAVVRDLVGTLRREKAPFSFLITLEPPTEGMQEEAAEAGVYEVPSTGEKIPKVQIMTIRELLEGKRPKVPTTQVSPVQRAPRIKRKAAESQLPLTEK